ncbi:MAG TPA: hypothetical protein VKQ72_15445 [Aggregatilineales bacterium]|nr:hypothetical protein [Aggregatilineales bacterium]
MIPMIPLRVQVKFFVDNPNGLDLTVFSVIFQRWIQQNKLEGQMIDVADYLHVPDGPGIVFIGDQTDYAMEQTGRLGLLTTRKRQHSGVQDQLRDAFRLGLTACALLEAEPELKGKIKFRTDEAEIRFLDRLQLPNRPESLDLVQSNVQAVLSEVYGDAPASFERIGDEPRHVLTLAVRAPGAAPVAALVEQVKAKIG